MSVVLETRPSLEYKDEIQAAHNKIWSILEENVVDVFLSVSGFSPSLRNKKLKQTRNLYSRLSNKYTQLDTEEAIVFKGTRVDTHEYNYNIETSKHIPPPTNGRREVDISEAISEFKKEFSRITNNFDCVITVYHNHNNATKFSQKDIRTFLRTERMHEMYIDSGLDIIFLIKNDKPNLLIEDRTVISFDKVQDEVSSCYAALLSGIDELHKAGRISSDVKNDSYNLLTSLINYVKFAVASIVGIFKVDYGWVKKAQL
ncbi:MAG: hypothetical protein FWH07_02575 [Oscillospiraceae bacterium]|nr:hypothetical protein [Oscillospiraceae bacterium]